jgi:hypothetical protein
MGDYPSSENAQSRNLSVVSKRPTEPPKGAPDCTFSVVWVEAGPIDEETVQTITKVRMPDRPMHSEKDEWYELLDDLEGELLSVCDGTTTLNEIMAQYTSTPEGQSLEQKDVDEAQSLLQNIVHRLVRLYEHTLISW